MVVSMTLVHGCTASGERRQRPNNRDRLRAVINLVGITDAALHIEVFLLAGCARREGDLKKELEIFARSAIGIPVE